ncbi:hypothetical protein VOLCADRAFT_89472 [Volvox carteri f. nagariensis]|uniref:Uncharacterized protein n=1 Tax=Volvox carteri f. nagariensis TaxID=3068 RepID=D8TRX4_VOLCA|nr:uncharacterized protein VOLCADRAFT_89472 [Volvox carteri f. nagariensis]EFJ49722.1 hypothetical protein VOLCADRAFT_89472 [Volvox carteri f. nagariensis]|eukprot:XP_002949229.1 hypothetical protein VOLCADRAFT_89472 [Volvox carteri f. nagariensis]
MDDIRALQEACLRDRQERDQWQHAFLAEQDKCKNLQLRLDHEAQHAAKLLDAVAQRRKAQQNEVTAAVSYQKTLLELTALQQAHLESQQVRLRKPVTAHHEEVEALRNQLDTARRTTTDLESELAAERAGRVTQVDDLMTQLKERTAAAAAEVAALHESYGGRLGLLEDFKNQLLADKAAAEERWSRERASLKAQQAESAAAAAAGGGSSEAAWKARLMRLRAEADAVRRERDAAHAALRAAGITPPAPSAVVAPPLAPGNTTSVVTAATAGGGGAVGGGGLPMSSAAAAHQAAQRHNTYDPGQLHLPPQQQQQQQHPPPHHTQQQQQHPATATAAGHQAARGPLRNGGGGLGAAPRMALGGPMGRPGSGGPGGLGAAYGLPGTQQLSHLTVALWRRLKPGARGGPYRESGPPRAECPLEAEPPGGISAVHTVLMRDVSAPSQPGMMGVTGCTPPPLYSSGLIPFTNAAPLPTLTGLVLLYYCSSHSQAHFPIAST